MTSKLPRLAWVLGLAGLIPQLIALLASFGKGSRSAGLVAGFFYPALIFSFLGGLWWGAAVGRENARSWIYIAAVVPTLIAFLGSIPLMFGDPMLRPSLVTLGLALIASAGVDRALARGGYMPKQMAVLRVILSIGLGGFTLALALRA